MIQISLRNTLSLQGVTLDGEFTEVFRGEYVTIVRDGADIYEILNSNLNEI